MLPHNRGQQHIQHLNNAVRAQSLQKKYEQQVGYNSMTNLYDAINAVNQRASGQKYAKEDMQQLI